MGTIERRIIKIPAEKLSGVDHMFGRMINMDTEKLPAKFQTAFEKTKEAAYQNFRMEAVFESFKVERIEGDSIHLENAVVLNSGLMAEVFCQSFELVFAVTTLHGYEALDEAEENILLKLFLDSWGTALIECGNQWVEQNVAKELEDKEIYATHSFSPGQNDIPMEMQTQIFQAINPKEIGVTLNDRYMMHPKKSVSGIFGIQTEKIENRIRPCDICERKHTCPASMAR